MGYRTATGPIGAAESSGTDGSAVEVGAIVSGHSAPHTVGLVRFERVLTALLEHRATAADLFR